MTEKTSEWMRTETWYIKFLGEIILWVILVYIDYSSITYLNNLERCLQSPEFSETLDNTDVQVEGSLIDNIVIVC